MPTEQLIFTEDYTGPRFTYGCMHRPPGLASVPVGRIIGADKRTEQPDPRVLHGTIQYARPLTEAEIDGYELLPIWREEQDWEFAEEKAPDEWETVDIGFDSEASAIAAAQTYADKYRCRVLVSTSIAIINCELNGVDDRRFAPGNPEPIILSPAALKSGAFVVRFSWAEGNFDTGRKDQDIEDFARSLAGVLFDNGAWDVHIYGPDGDQLPITNA
jgi:hypothetical protein